MPFLDESYSPAVVCKHANAKNSLCRKQWTIFMRKQWIVLINAKNRFYECSKQIWIYSLHDVQRANFINVEIDFINWEK